ncbi:cytosolic sulfotransferase 18-like [Brassica napus]|uniref:cytosolic sulfotransferase 18-like n=1 Tax=Brassica napus TaxID=3708 RepID=UPI002078ADBE|nr:cytosolic sulfotransferase 18-like [Brassica napus]
MDIVIRINKTTKGTIKKQTSISMSLLLIYKARYDPILSEQNHFSSHTDQKHMSSNLLPLSPMATETVRDSTVPNHDETELTEFQKNQKRYQDLISTLPHVKGWRPKSPLIWYGGHWWIQPFLEGSLYAQEFFQARPNDFLVCSYPKTGSTWLKSLTFTIANRSRFDDFTNPLLKRNPHELIPFLEIEFPLFPHVDVLQDKENTLFSTHMPHDFLPDSVEKSGCKMVYIWRDPKDTFISFWSFMQKQRSTRGPLNSLEECFDMFCQGISGDGPYLDHVLGYWKAHQENPDKILFLKYETVRADPLPCVKRLAEFMGYGFTAEEEKSGVVEKVVNLCSFETMKNLEANKGDKERGDHPSPYTNSTYFRKGKTGDWVNYLTPEMAARMDGIMEEKFKGTGLLENGE